MVDKHELLKQMRKHAKNFSSAVSPVKEVDQKSINRALALIDLFSKERERNSINHQLCLSTLSLSRELSAVRVYITHCYC